MIKPLRQERGFGNNVHPWLYSEKRPEKGQMGGGPIRRQRTGRGETSPSSVLLLWWANWIFQIPAVSSKSISSGHSARISHVVPASQRRTLSSVATAVLCLTRPAEGLSLSGQIPLFCVQTQTCPQICSALIKQDEWRGEISLQDIIIWWQLYRFWTFHPVCARVCKPVLRGRKTLTLCWRDHNPRFY